MFIQSVPNIPGDVVGVGLAMFVLWGMVGICPEPPRWPFPGPPPWWMPVLGIVGGILGGYVFTQVFDLGAIRSPAVLAATSSVGAFVGSVVVQTIASLAVGRGGIGDVNRPGPG